MTEWGSGGDSMHNWKLAKTTEPQVKCLGLVFWIQGLSVPPCGYGHRVIGSRGNRLVFSKPLAFYWPEKITLPSSALLCDGGICKSGLYFTGASKENASLLEG